MIATELLETPPSHPNDSALTSSFENALLYVSLRDRLESSYAADTEDARFQCMSESDLRFWNYKPPQKIILASASIRKGMMFAQLFSGLAFPGSQQHELLTRSELEYRNSQSDSDGGPLRLERARFGEAAEGAAVSQTPLQFQDFMDRNIHNGDGALKTAKEVLVGYLHGVPVYIRRTEGESKNNVDALQESRNKIDDLQALYVEQDVLFLATDTMSKVSSLPEAAEKLGKPMNMPNFPGKDASPEKIEAFKQWYKETFYPVGSKITHLSGTVIRRVVNGQLEPALSSEELIPLEAVVTQEIYDKLQIYLDVGGGGVLQQLFQWDTTANFLDQVSNVYMQQELQQTTHLQSRTVARELTATPDGADVEHQQWLTYCHIAGVPAWHVLAQLRQWSADSV